MEVSSKKSKKIAYIPLDIVCNFLEFLGFREYIYFCRVFKGLNCYLKKVRPSAVGRIPFPLVDFPKGCVEHVSNLLVPCLESLSENDKYWVVFDKVSKLFPNLKSMEFDLPDDSFKPPPDVVRNRGSANRRYMFYGNREVPQKISIATTFCSEVFSNLETLCVREYEDGIPNEARKARRYVLVQENFPRLRRLIAGDFSFELPERILKRLEVLAITRCTFFREVDLLNGFENLRILRIHDCGIFCSHLRVENCPKLTRVEFSGSANGMADTTLKNNPKLEYVSIWCFEEESLRHFRTCSYVSGLGSLKHLNICNIRFFQFTERIEDYSVLETLHLERIQDIGRVLREGLQQSKFRNLKDLKLRMIRGVQMPLEFDGLEFLEKVDFEGVDVKSFRNCGALKNVRIECGIHRWGSKIGPFLDGNYKIDEFYATKLKDGNFEKILKDSPQLHIEHVTLCNDFPRYGTGDLEFMMSKELISLMNEKCGDVVIQYARKNEDDEDW